MKAVGLYENSNNNESPEFNFIQKDFIQTEGVDLGENAHPTFYDFDGDGLKDLFIGNYGYHLASGTPISKIVKFTITFTNTSKIHFNNRRLYGDFIY